MISKIKKRIGLDFIILFIFLTHYLFTIESWHEITFIPMQGPPRNYIFSFIIFILLAVYFFISWADFKKEKKFFYKSILLFSIILFFIFSMLAYQIVLREKTNNPKYIHDGAVQTEEAVKFLSLGKNHYAVNYQNTSFGVFGDFYSGEERANPAWYYHVYLPFYSLFSVPFYKISSALFSFYDQRIVYGLLFLLSLFIIYKLPENRNMKLIGLIIFAFNPLFFPYLIQGYNDIFVFFWLLASLYLLKLRRFYWSAALLALACASKQSAWLILPFYFSYLYFLENKVKIFTQKIGLVFKKFIPFIIISLLIFIPFLIWSPNDFIEDIFLYPAGAATLNFPMIGYGVSSLVYKMGLVESTFDYFPFGLIQALIGLPLIYFLIKKQKKNNNLSNLIFSYGILLLVFWFFSRFFNNNYISYLSMIFLVGYLIEEKKPLGGKNR